MNVSEGFCLSHGAAVAQCSKIKVPQNLCTNCKMKDPWYVCVMD